MAGLEIRFAAGDKLIVNGAAIQFESDARIRFVNKVEFLYGRQIMSPDEATTPARRIYFSLQTAYVGTEEERASALSAAQYFISSFANETTSEEARQFLSLAWEAAREKRGYDALRFARRVMRHEDAVLSQRENE